MVVIALDRCCGFLEADVVESSEGSATDVFDRVIWDQKLLLRATHQDEKWQQLQVRGDSARTQGRAQFSLHLTFHLMKM